MTSIQCTVYLCTVQYTLQAAAAAAASVVLFADIFGQAAEGARDRDTLYTILNTVYSVLYTVYTLQYTI